MVGQKILKSPVQKKLVKSNKSISRKNFFTKFHFLQFHKRPKITFWTGENFKNAKIAISRKKVFDLFDFTSFFARTFLNFLAHMYEKQFPTAKVFSNQKYKNLFFFCFQCLLFSVTVGWFLNCPSEPSWWKKDTIKAQWKNDMT